MALAGTVAKDSAARLFDCWPVGGRVETMNDPSLCLDVTDSYHLTRCRQADEYMREYFGVQAESKVLSVTRWYKNLLVTTHRDQDRSIWVTR